MQSIPKKLKVMLIVALALTTLILFTRHYLKSNYLRMDLYTGSGYGGVIGESKRQTLQSITDFYKGKGVMYSRSHFAALLPLDSAWNDTATLWETDNWTLYLPIEKDDMNNVGFDFQGDTLWFIERYRNTSFIPNPR